jgi:hypothetical protein
LGEGKIEREAVVSKGGKKGKDNRVLALSHSQNKNRKKMQGQTNIFCSTFD